MINYIPSTSYLWHCIFPCYSMFVGVAIQYAMDAKCQVATYNTIEISIRLCCVHVRTNYLLSALQLPITCSLRAEAKRTCAHVRLPHKRHEKNSTNITLTVLQLLIFLCGQHCVSFFHQAVTPMLKRASNLCTRDIIVYYFQVRISTL